MSGIASERPDCYFNLPQAEHRGILGIHREAYEVLLLGLEQILFCHQI